MTRKKLLEALQVIGDNLMVIDAELQAANKREHQRDFQAKLTVSSG